MADVPRETEPLDPLEEALVELARSAIRNRAEASGRRAKMKPLDAGSRRRKVA